MFKSPLRIAIVVFVTALVLGAVVLFMTGAFQASASSSFEKGQYAGKILGPPALFLAVAAYFIARARMRK